MKELLILKRIDFWSQPIAIIAPVIIGAIINEPWLALCIHFSLGGVQVISCLLNRFFLPDDYRAGSRGFYEIVLLVFAIIGVFVLIATNGKGSGSEDFVIMYLLVMLVAGIVMGIWYMNMSYSEMDYVEKLVKRHELIK